MEPLSWKAISGLVTLEPLSWKAKAALVALAVVIAVGTLGLVVRSNKDRAEDWHRRAIAAEESVGGLRVVIGERSRALNRRTAQANQLVSKLDSTRAALRRSKVSVGALTERQRRLSAENASIEKERRKLRTRQAALVTIASKLSTCTKSLGGGSSAAKGKNRVTAASRLASCRRAGASLDAYLEQFG
jgi:chromosome segregation ATPase